MGDSIYWRIGEDRGIDYERVKKKKKDPKMNFE